MIFAPTMSLKRENKDASIIFSPTRGLKNIVVNWTFKTLSRKLHKITKHARRFFDSRMFGKTCQMTKYERN